MAQPYYVTITLESETCCTCGVVFGIESRHRAELRRKKERTSFYCPNGHSQHYIGDTEADKLRRELEWARSQRDSARSALKMTENTLRVVKGHKTRLKKRIANGVCPCCNRNFENVARHIKTKHPEYAGLAAEGLE